MDKNNNRADADSDQPDFRWLLLGAFVGLIAAGYGILRQDTTAREMPTTAIARVNDTMISRDRFERELARFAESADDELPPSDQALLLDNLVDEELLLQRGMALGMAQSDSAVRTAIVNSLVASVTAEADSATPTDEQLEAYLASNAERFSFTAKLEVNGWQTDDEAVAQAFVAHLRETGDAPSMKAISAVPDLPDELVPTEILRDVLGPGITAAIAGMPPGSSAIFARRGRWLVIRVGKKQTAAVTDLNSIRNRVLLDYRRDLADSTLREYLDNLRSRADVTVSMP